MLTFEGYAHRRLDSIHVSAFMGLLSLHQALVLLRDNDAFALEALGALSNRIVLGAVLRAALQERSTTCVQSY